MQAFVRSQNPGVMDAAIKQWAPIDLQKLPWTGEFQVPPIKNEDFYDFELKLPTTEPVLLEWRIAIRVQSGA